MVKNKKKSCNLIEAKYVAIIIVVILVILIAIFYRKDIKITMPDLVVEPNNEWNKNAIVKITKDSVSNSNITGYMYCISTEKKEDNCDWKQTITKSFEVYENGVNYVFVKGIDEEDNLSKAVLKTIRIDNDAPNINKVSITNKTDNEITVSVDAFDSLTNIKYYYSINNSEFVEANNTYNFNNLTSKTNYQIIVKVIDEAGNEKEVGLEETTN